MVFILRSERAPTRVVRETDEGGTSRTFWLWRDGAWVVVTRSIEGVLTCSCSDRLDVSVEEGENVTIVRVVHPAAVETLPAPPPESEQQPPAYAISAVMAVAPRVADVDFVGVHGIDPSSDPRRAAGG
jgi:hypothetical protein